MGLGSLPHPLPVKKPLGHLTWRLPLASLQILSPPHRLGRTLGIGIREKDAGTTFGICHSL